MEPHLVHSYTIIDPVPVLPFQTAGIEGFGNGQGLPGMVCWSNGDIVSGVDWFRGFRIISIVERTQGAVE